jgi:hypothetical protein
MYKEGRREGKVSRKKSATGDGRMAGSDTGGSISSPASVPAETASAQANPVTLKVYNPTGTFEITQAFAPRLPDLNGKTLCEVSDDSWEYDRTFPIIRDLLKKQFPTMRIITHDHFPHGIPGMDVDALGPALQKAGCQGVIVGNAG